MKSNEKKRISRLSWHEIVLACLFICLFAYTCYLILTKMNPYGLSSDVSNEITFRLYTYEHKTLFPKTFIVGHELLISRPILIWWVLYALTHNYMLSYELEIICVLLLEFAAFWFLCSKLKLGRCARIIILCMYLSVWHVGLGDTYNYHMYGYFDIYSLFGIATLLTLALRVCMRERISENEKGWGSKYIALLLLIAAAGGVTSVRLAMSLYVPLAAIDLVMYFFDYINGRMFTRRQLITAAVDILCLLVNVVAYGMTVHFYGDAFNPTSISIRSIGSWLSWDVLSEQLANVLYTLGVAGEGPLVSVGGINFLVRGCFAFFAATAVIWLLKRKKDGQDGIDDIKELAIFYVSTTLVQFLLGIFSGMIATRYYWASALSILPVCGAAVNQWMRGRQGKDGDLVCAVLTLGLIAMFGLNVKQDMKSYSAAPPVLTQAADYIEQNGYKYVTASFWNAGVIEGYTNGAVDYQHDIDAEGNLEKRRWMIDIEKYKQPKEGIPNILLLTDDEEKTMQGNPVSGKLIEEYGEKVQEIDIYNLYAFTENPFTLVEKIKAEEYAGLPGEGVEEKTDELSDLGFAFVNSSINEDGELVTDGSEGSGFYGPYSQSVEGTYDITMHYVVDAYDEQMTGVFDVALDMMQIAVTEFDASQTSVTLEDVSIDEGKKFEVRMSAPEGMIVRVQSIDYERVDG